MRRLLLLGLLVLMMAAMFAGSAASRHDSDHKASGQWQLTFPANDPEVRRGRAKTATLMLRAVSRPVADKERAKLKFGRWLAKCGSTAKDYYVGSFRRDTDSGPVIGCIHPTSSIFHAVFQSTQYRVEGAIAGPLGGPVAVGLLPAEPDYVIGSSFVRHFLGDGAGGDATCRIRKSGLRSEKSVVSQAASAPPQRISDTDEYKTFVGACDVEPVPTRRGWGLWLQAKAREFIRAVSTFPGLKTEEMLTGETSFGQHSARLIELPISDFYSLLAGEAVMRDLRREGNVFALATADYEPRLRKLILQSKGGLYPDDVVKLALKVTKGSYPLAVLTAHNLLKNITKDGRFVIAVAEGGPAKFRASPNEFLAPLRDHNQVIEKLASLRWKPARDRDKMGPWYHIFAVTTAGALSWNPTTARDVVLLEHSAKDLNIFENESGHDLIKHQIDHCFAFAAGEEPIAKVSRFWEHSSFARLFARISIDDCLLPPIKYATD